MKKISKQGAILVAFLAPTLAQADAFNPAPIAGGTAISGLCMSMGQIATPSNMSSLSNHITDAIKKMGNVLRSGQQEQIKAQQNLMNEDFQKRVEILKKLLATKQQLRYQMQTTGVNKVVNNCADGSIAKAMQDGAKKAVQSKKDMSDNVDKGVAPTTNPIGKMNLRMVDFVPSQWDSTTLNNSEASDEDVQKTIEHLVAPSKVASLSKDQENTPNGQAWKAAENVASSKISLAKQSLLDSAFGDRPTIDATDIKKRWSDAGMTEPADPYGLSKDKTKISPDGLFKSYVALRYANETHNNDINTKGETWQVKQYAITLAQRLYSEQRQVKLLQDMVAMQSASLANNLKPSLVHISDSKARAGSQSIQDVNYQDSNKK